MTISNFDGTAIPAKSWLSVATAGFLIFLLPSLSFASMYNYSDPVTGAGADIMTALMSFAFFPGASMLGAIVLWRLKIRRAWIAALVSAPIFFVVGLSIVYSEPRGNSGHGIIPAAFGAASLYVILYFIVTRFQSKHQ